jgi:2-hydroxy-3-keto-5-methylthiopentenyl-1-phosphate phosphatase
MVLESKLLFRHGIKEILENTVNLGIPFYIVSAGIAEIIEAHFCTIMENGDVTSNSARASWE